MASGIPTRRITRRVDENAPPGATISTRSRTAVSSTTASGASTSIPVMRRTNSTLTGTSSRTASENKPPAGVASTALKATKRRAALGELPVAADKENPAKGDTALKHKASAGVERRPLTSTTQPQQPVRRTTRAAAGTGLEDKTTAVKRKAGPSVATRRPAVSRAGSTTSLTSTSTSTSASTLRATRQLKPTASLPEAGPVPKRLRPSSTPEPEDVLGDAQYDEDNASVVLENFIRAPQHRAKDYGWTDLDAEDDGDPTMVSEYVVDAFKYMMEIEKSSMPDPEYMEKQSELQWKMRAILNDWIIEVHSKFRLLPETLLIATNLIDRFLSERMVSLIKFQLVGLTALFVAAKYEEVICPSINHFLHMSDGGYKVDEILRAERYLLAALSFDLSYPNPLHFLRRVSKADGYDVHARTVAKFFIEISCIDHRLLPFPPSMLAAAAMWLARLCLDRGPWHANMVHYSAYSQEELLPCAQVMLDYVVSPDLDTNSAFFKKYAGKKHLKASVFVRDWAVHRWPESAKGETSGNELSSEFGGVTVAPLPCTP